MIASTRDTQRDAPERLLAESGWIRTLARRLVADANRAADLEQATWVRILTRPPRDDGPIRGWIATVMRNLARQTRRADTRRTHHETRAADQRSADPQPSPPAAIERAERQREVLDAVMRLPEPYRTALVLHYLESRSANRIATSLGVPITTIKTRLARGRERLRADLDRRHGRDGRSWIVALLPMTRLPRATPLGWLPVSAAASAVTVIMQLKHAVLLGGLALAVVGAGWFFIGASAHADHAADPQPSIAGTSVPVVSATRSDETSQDAPNAVRHPVATQSQGPSTHAPPAALGTIRGRVLTVRGVVVADSQVRLASADNSDEDRVARTASDGTYEFTVEKRLSHAWVELADPRYTTVLSAHPVANRDDVLPVVVVAPRASIDGRIVDANGAPIPNARVTIRLPADLRSHFTKPVLDHSTDRQFATQSDAEGAFALESTPVIETAQLVVTADGYRQLEHDAPTRIGEHALLTLEAATRSSAIVRGIVVGPSGTPVDGALVACGLDTTKTDADGAFEIDLRSERSFNSMIRGVAEPDLRRITAVHPGYLPATASIESAGDDGYPIQREPITLRLGTPPLTLTGHVVDEHGKPLAGIEVWIADRTLFGGRAVPGRRFPQLDHVEDILRPVDSGDARSVKTDDAGRFELGGLTDRAYTIHAMDPNTLLRSVTADVRADRGEVRLLLSGEGLFASLRGRVIDSRGEPLAGISVQPMCDTIQTKIDGRVVGTDHATTDGTRTAADGTFELRRVPRDLTYLRVEGPDTIPIEWGRDIAGSLTTMVDGRPEALEIRVSRRCHFRVELADPASADEVAVHDANGESLSISAFEGRSRRDNERQPIVKGRTNQLAVSDGALTLLLLRGGEIVRRLPIRLVPGEPTVVRD